MNGTEPLSLTAWQNFYVIVGSAAAALTGLQFVVLTLLTQAKTAVDMRDIRAFGSPTVAHFGTALVISAFMTVPWTQLNFLSDCLTALGAAGVIYLIRAFLHARKSSYKPEMEDWIWYTVCPLLGYVALTSIAFVTEWNARAALGTTATASVAFLLLGIRNSWDTVTYIAVQHTTHLPQTGRTSPGT